MLKKIICDQYQSKIDQLIDIKEVNRPKEGWIRTFGNGRHARIMGFVRDRPHISQ